MTRLYLAGKMSGLPGNNYGTFNAEADGLGMDVYRAKQITEGPK